MNSWGISGFFFFFFLERPSRGEGKGKELERLSPPQCHPFFFFFFVFFLDGTTKNFANPPCWTPCRKKAFGAPVRVAPSNVFPPLARIRSKPLEEKKCFALRRRPSLEPARGGTAGKSWWEAEIPSEEEFRRELVPLRPPGWDGGTGFSPHTAPEGILKTTNLAQSTLPGTPYRIPRGNYGKSRGPLGSAGSAAHLHRTPFFPPRAGSCAPGEHPRRQDGEHCFRVESGEPPPP